jgi:hypothetical protein
MTDGGTRTEFVLHDVPLYIGLISTLALIVSLAHEFFYFFILDITFLSILSPSDYLRQALLWLPFTAIGTGIGIYAGVQQRKTGEVLDRRAEITGLRRHIWAARVNNWAFLVLACLTSLGLLIGFLLEPERPQLVILPAAMVVGLVSVRNAYKSGVQSDILVKFIWLTTFFGTVVLLTPPLRGIEQAYADLRRAEPAYKVMLANDDQFLALVLRTLDKGLLIRQPEVGLSFIPWDAVRSLTRLRTASPARSLFVIMRGWFVREPAPEAP